MNFNDDSTSYTVRVCWKLTRVITPLESGMKANFRKFMEATEPHSLYVEAIQATAPDE
jgi:hypothetical protein